MNSDELILALPGGEDDDTDACDYDVVVNGLIIGSVVVNHDDRTIELVPE